MKFPHVLETLPTEVGRCLTLQVPPNLLYLQGHFPEMPVVPGVVQLHWVMEVLEDLLETSIETKKMEAVKFREPLLPGSHFHLEVRQTDDHTWSFRLWYEQQKFSSGRVLLSGAL